MYKTQFANPEHLSKPSTGDDSLHRWDPVGGSLSMAARATATAGCTTDPVCVCPAGDSLHMWDPAGGSLSMAARASAAGGGDSNRDPPPAKPQARKFRFVGTELPTHFAHQFAPWGFAGRDVAAGVDGTLLRLAMRTTAAGPIGQVHLSICFVKSLCA